MADVVLTHKDVSPKSASSDPTKIDGPKWNKAHGYTGGSAYQVVRREPSATNGAGWGHPLEVVDVRSYGAVGDGVTDDTASFQAALDAVVDVSDIGNPAVENVYSNRGGVIYVPSGSYKITSTLTIKRGTVLLGAGSESTILLYSAATGDVLSYMRPNSALSSLPSITIKGLRIAVPQAITHTSGAGIRIDSSDPTPALGTKAVLEDIVVIFTHEGFNLRNLQGGVMQYCHAWNNKDRGIIFRGFTTLFTCSTSYASGAVSHGWHISGWSYSHAIGCGSDSNGGHGWLVKRESGDASVNNNTFQIGSEGSLTSLFTFDTCNDTFVQCFGLARTSGSTTTDGLVINSCLGFQFIPRISTETTATGFPVKLTGTNGGIVQLGGFVGLYAAGTRQYSGVDTNAFTVIGYQSAGRMLVGGATATSAAPSFPFQVVNRTGAAAAQGVVVGDARYIASSLGGSGIFRVSADNGSSFAEVEHNSGNAGPHRTGTTFQDAIFRSSNAGVILMAGSDFLKFDNGVLGIPDGSTAPAAVTGRAQIYVDTADGDLKVIFGDGVIKTLAVDT